MAKFEKTREFFNNKTRNIVIVATCINVIMVIAIIVPVIYLVATSKPCNNEPETPNPNPIPNPEFLVQRDEWNAAPPKEGILPMLGPIKRFIIAHTGSNSCANEDECKEFVKKLQNDSMTQGLDDIPYNFLIGGDGNVYEGRGFEFQGQHTATKDATEYNSIGICIAFVGNFSVEEPTPEQITVFTDFILYFVSVQKIYYSYIILSQDDLVFTNTSATKLNNAIKSMAKFKPLQKVYQREEWNASSLNSSLPKFGRVMDWVLLTNIEHDPCDDESECMAIVQEQQNNTIIAEDQDIKFNFIIGDGFVFEGRGWDFVANFSEDCNPLAVAVALIGKFESTPPNSTMLDSLKALLDDGAALGKISVDFVFDADESLKKSTEFMNAITSLNSTHYGNGTRNCTDNF